MKMVFASQGFRRARSLLHWKVDPEIFVLVGAVTCIGGVALYTLNRKGDQGQNKSVVQPGTVSDPNRILGYSKEEYSKAADKKL